MNNRTIYERLYTHALANYSNGGWDYFVECCDFEEFCRIADRHNWQTYEAALQYYQNIYYTLDSVRQDIQAA